MKVADFVRLLFSAPPFHKSCRSGMLSELFVTSDFVNRAARLGLRTGGNSIKFKCLLNFKYATRSFNFKVSWVKLTLKSRDI